MRSPAAGLVGEQFSTELRSVVLPPPSTPSNVRKNPAMCDSHRNWNQGFPFHLSPASNTIMKRPIKTSTARIKKAAANGFMTGHPLLYGTEEQHRCPYLLLELVVEDVYTKPYSSQKYKLTHSRHKLKSKSPHQNKIQALAAVASTSCCRPGCLARCINCRMAMNSSKTKALAPKRPCSAKSSKGIL